MALARIFKHLEGPQTMGRGKLFWAGFIVVLLAAVVYPLTSDGYTVGNSVYFLNWTFMALGAQPHLGLWRLALLRADGLLRCRGLQLRHPHHQFRRGLWPRASPR